MCHNASLFVGTIAIFDESRFPRCGQKKKPLPHPPSNEDNDDDDLEPDPSDEGQPPNLLDSNGDDPSDQGHHDGPPSNNPDPKSDPDYTPDPSSSQRLNLDNLDPPRPSRSNFEPCREDQEEWQNLPRRSGRTRTILTRPDNVYGEKRLPSDLVHDVARDPYWKRTVGDTDNHRIPRIQFPENLPQIPHMTSDRPQRNLPR